MQIKNELVKIKGEWFIDVHCNVEGQPVLLKVEETECECGQELHTEAEVESGLCYQCYWLIGK